MRNYIGLAVTPHDPALAIVNSRGEIVFAEATERYLQNKRAWNCLPDDIVRLEYLLKQYCEPGADLVVATSWTVDFVRRIQSKGHAVKNFVKDMLPAWIFHAWQSIATGIAVNSTQAGANIALRFHQVHPAARVINRSYNHHLTHAAAACYSSPFTQAVCAVLDGYGEGSSTAFYRYHEGRLSSIEEIKPSRNASLGIYYSALCWACGFDPLKGEEWKVMGLAAYGKYDEQIYRLLRPMLGVKKTRLTLRGDAITRLKKLFEMRPPPDRPALSSANLAFTGQQVFCELCEEILCKLHRLTGEENLVLTGGCALNSSWNGKILQKTPFKRLYLPCAPADDGNAVGAALLAYCEDNPGAVPPAGMQSPYLGESMSALALDSFYRYGNLQKKPLARAAQLLAQGKIIGWMQGRAEFGPRALGNRSILADPRCADVKERLNCQVKFREEFRPFAPSILHEYGDQYFENYQQSPYMERTLRFKPAVTGKVPGVVHADGTGRVQSVTREANGKFYDLISAFNELTGIPLVLNTSFNVMGKPIIHTIQDAIAVFFTTGLDALVLGDHVYEKLPHPLGGDVGGDIL